MDCKVPVILAYIMACYALASLLYLLITFFGNVGTPLKDAINADEKLRKIREDARNIRGKIFLFSFIIVALLLFFFQPFKTCDNLSVNDLFLTGYDN
jgi:hypothetical protein